MAVIKLFIYDFSADLPNDGTGPLTQERISQIPINNISSHHLGT